MKEIVNEICNTIEINWQLLQSAIEIDQKYTNMTIKKEEIISIINKFKNAKANNNSKKVMAFYYGHPYVTMQLCMMAITNNSKLVLGIEDMCLAFNMVLISILNDTIDKKHLNASIVLKNLLSKEEGNKIAKEADSTLFIGNNEVYQIYDREEIKNMCFVPYNNIMLYCDGEEFEDLRKTIFEICYYNNFELEFLENYELKEAIDQMNESGYTCVVLTKNEETKNIFKLKLDKELYINKNPIKLTDINLPIESFS